MGRRISNAYRFQGLMGRVGMESGGLGGVDVRVIIMVELRRQLAFEHLRTTVVGRMRNHEGGKCGMGEASSMQYAMSYGALWC
jgi:hypothetical protein